jgi:hypothetical protein
MVLDDDEQGFGGTIDALARGNSGSVVLLDYKTGGGVYVEHLYQLGGYLCLLECVAKVTAEEVHLLRMGRAGEFHHHSWSSAGPTLRAAQAGFSRMRELYELDKVVREGL